VSVVQGQRTLFGAIASEDVRLLQTVLAKAGFDPGPVDGVYGYETAAAVRRFQKERGLEADGMVGPGTWSALGKERVGKPLRSRTLRGVLHGATSGEDVTQAQRALAGAGFDPGEIDGVYGPRTARAVRRFQAENGLAADGIVGTVTWSALLPPRPGDVGTFERAPELVLVWTDLMDREPFVQAASSFGRPWRSYDVPDLDPQVVEEWVDLVAVVFLSSGYHWSPGGDMLIERHRAGELRVVPVRLRPVALIDTPFADLEVLPADGAALEEVEHPAAVFRELLTPFLGPPPPTSLLPGFATDATDGVALFGVGERVEFLASLLTAWSLETPLAIGLFGDWGSGKSFFMRRLQERIGLLTERSAQAEEHGQPTLYCSHIRQVTFNAWLYSDSDIWPTFAAQVFRSVTGATDDVQPGATQAGHLADYQKELRGLEERRSEAERQEAGLEQRLTEIDEEIGAKQEEIGARAGDLGEEAKVTTKLVADLGEIWRRLANLVRNWRSIRASDLVILAMPVAVAVSAVFFDWARILAGLAVVGGAVTLLLSSLRYVDRTRALQDEIADLEREKRRLEADREQRSRERASAERDLGAAVELPLLPQFAEEQAARWLGRQQLGVVTEIRLAFERLSRMIDESRSAKPEAREGPERTLPIDRVIIYVDDLDRCPHDVVVRVLETIKVLLDLPHFVVVVGVDSRWLLRSIQVHFSELLHPDDASDPDAAWATTPQNYLEKIFQYSIVLRPLEKAGFVELIESLLPTGVQGEIERDAERAELQVDVPDQYEELEDESETATDEADEDGSGNGPAFTEPKSAAEIGLTPGNLVITPEEVAYMKRLGPLFDTPRAAKRLANVYRLLRVSTGADRLADPDGYEPVLLLLAVSISYPGLAGEFFQAVRKSPTSSLAALLKDLPPPTKPPRPPGEMAVWDKLVHSLSTISREELPDRELKSFAEWVPVVAEFSFHPWQELLAAETRS
jgi:hypothetical protein